MNHDHLAPVTVDRLRRLTAGLTPEQFDVLLEEINDLVASAEEEGAEKVRVRVARVLWGD